MVSRLKRICHLNLASGYSGGERQTELLVCELARRGVAQRLVVRESTGLAERCAAAGGLDIRIVSGNHPAAARAIRGCSIAHAHDGRSAYAALLGHWLYRVPYVATRRVITGKPIGGLRGAAYGRAARVAAVSRATAENLAAHGLGRPVDVIPDAQAGLEVDESRVAAIRTAHAGKTLIGHAGILDDSAKGQSTIIEAA
ncbi:MAG: glycosyltransferase, partial [Proteobacteria bacterium]|nr:glycosyltransferase [Pseudomonadota bacterium]